MATEEQLLELRKQMRVDLKTMAQQQLESDCKTHGIIFNFINEEGETKTGIVRKGEYKEGLFLNGFIPNYRRMTRRERRTL